MREVNNQNRPKISTLFMLASTLLLAGGCGRARQGEELFKVVNSNAVTRIMQNDRRTNSREAAFLIDALDRTDSKIVKDQADILRSERARTPQVLEYIFEYDHENSLFHLKPIEMKTAPVKQELKANFVVVGGELASITLAMDVAKKGRKVLMVYSGNLGGICGQEGANLRFFDRTLRMEDTPSQKELFDAIGVTHGVVIPPNTDRRIERFLETRYPNIERVKTARLLDVSLTLTGRNISSITTPEGIRIKSDVFIDSTPDGILAEKMGLPMLARTPQLADGFVFDVKGLSYSEIRRIADNDCVTFERICEALRLNPDDAKKNEQVKLALEEFQKASSQSASEEQRDYVVGLKKFGAGFQLYMVCKGLKDEDPELAQLNMDRVMTGFNVAIDSSGTANFNSVSYRYPFLKFQDHIAIDSDPDLLPIHKFDVPGLHEYFALVLSKSMESIQIQAPKELYVRRATAMFSPESFVDALSMKDLAWRDNSKQLPISQMCYNNDLRGISQRDAFDPQDTHDFMPIPRPLDDCSRYSKTMFVWNIDPNYTKIIGSNTRVISKSLPPLNIYGANRIVAGHIRTGYALANELK